VGEGRSWVLVKLFIIWDEAKPLNSPQIIYTVRVLNLPLSSKRGAHIGSAGIFIFGGELKIPQTKSFSNCKRIATKSQGYLICGFVAKELFRIILK
jgi:hypothetical protein